MRKLITTYFLLLCVIFSHAQTIRLWDGTKVKAKSVTLTTYIPDSCATETAVIICPGGSYCWHDRETEGSDVARWLQSKGIAAFVLNYRVQGIFQYVTHSRLIVPGRQYPDMLEDLQMAILYVRNNAARLGVNQHRVGVMGFSAGGHLAMLSAERTEDKFLRRRGIDVVTSLRPDFVAPIYPVVTMQGRYVHKRSRRGLLGDYRKYRKSLRDSLSLENYVPSDCPPVFLVNCKDDPVVKYQNSELLDSALSAKGIRHRYIQYATGGHGFGASDTKGTAECRQWRDEFIQWIKGLWLRKTACKT